MGTTERPSPQLLAAASLAVSLEPYVLPSQSRNVGNLPGPHHRHHLKVPPSYVGEPCDTTDTWAMPTDLRRVHRNAIPVHRLKQGRCGRRSARNAHIEIAAQPGEHIGSRQFDDHENR